MYQLDYSAKALADLKKLPKRIQVKVLDKLDFFAAQPDPLSFAKTLTGRPENRFRIGEYRALADFNKKQKTILVLRIGKRDKIYGIKI